MNPVTKRIALIAVGVALTTPGLAGAPPQRSFAVGSVGLELEGIFVGFVANAEGGNIFADVVKEPSGEDYFVKKHLANPGLRDIVLEFGGGMDPSLYKWIKGALQRQYLPKDGAVLMVDFAGTVRSRLEFHQAQITQVTFPGVDAASKDPIRFSIRLTPASTHLNRTAGGTTPSASLALQKQALASAFRLTIDGLDMSRTSAVEALTVNLPLLVDPSAVCALCEPIPPPPIDFPNVVVTLSAAYAGSVYDWLDDFVIEGNNSDESEKAGTLDYLTPNLESTLFQLSFQGLGVVEIAPVPRTDTDAVARVTVTMYCERIEFNFS